MSALKKTAQRCGFVIFGAKGDLTERKLIPALHKLFRLDLMPDDFFVLGCDPKPMTEKEYRSRIRASIRESSKDFLNRCYYLQMAGNNDMKVYAALKQKLDELNREYGIEGGRHVFHFSTPPETFGQILKSLYDLNLVCQSKSHWPRVAIEKPIGYSWKYAKELEEIFLDRLKEIDEQFHTRQLALESALGAVDSGFEQFSSVVSGFGKPGRRARARGLLAADRAREEIELLQGARDIREVFRNRAGRLPEFLHGGFSSGGLSVLHPGEFVLKRRAVESIGRGNLERVNRGQPSVGGITINIHRGAIVIQDSGNPAATAKAVEQGIVEGAVRFSKKPRQGGE